MGSLQVLDRIPLRQWEGLVPSIQSGRFVTTANCVQCEARRDWTTKTVHDPHIAVTRARKAGWAVGKEVVCPSCIAKRREEASRQAALRNIEKAGLAAKITTEGKPSMDNKEAPKPAPTEAAKRAKRLVYMALEDYYDEGKKAYKQGHSDASIATECGCSEEFVAKIREEDFGPLAEPAEVGQLRAQVARLREEALAARKEAELARVEAAAFVRRADDAAKDAEAVQRKVDVLLSDIASMVRRNGWRP